MTEYEYQKLYKSTFEHLHASPTDRMEVFLMKRTRMRTRLKRVAAAALTIAAVGTMGTTAVNAATGGELLKEITYWVNGEEADDVLYILETTEDGDTYYVYVTDEGDTGEIQLIIEDDGSGDAAETILEQQ